MNEIKMPTPSSVAISVDCYKCKKIFTVSVMKNDYEDWRQGLVIQKAFPYLPPELRELLISHICPVCWHEIFWEEEDE